MTNLLRDIRHGIRTLTTSPGVTSVIVAVLGIGIGANVALFTVLNAAFFRPLQVPEPDRLVEIQETPPGGGDMPVAYPNFLDWQKQSHSFEAMGIAGVFPETLKKASGNARIRALYMSPEFHVAYGLKPVVGRLLTAADDRPGAEPVAVLEHSFWETQFGGDPSVVGRKMVLDDRVWTIAGVAPPYHWREPAEVFVPITFGIDKWGLGMREQHSGTGVVARLKRGATLEQARSEMKVIAARLAKQYPGSNGGASAEIMPLQEYLGGSIRQLALLMFGAVVLLLFVACANVAGLLLARAAVREREIAIRTALGANRLQVIGQLLTESLLLALAGTVVGVGIARISTSGLVRIFPATENLGGVGLDPRVLIFSVLAAALTAVLFGLAPALQLTRTDVASTIRSGGRSSRGSAIRLHTRKILVVGQVALAVMLSVGAGLLIRSLVQVLRTNPGFRPEHVAVAPLLPPDRQDLDLSRNSRLLVDVADRLSSLPGVQAAGGINGLPFSNADSWGDFYRTDRPMPAPGHLPNAMQAAATPGYFRAMGIPLLRGRLFAASDGQMPAVKRDMPSVMAYFHSTRLVAVINESMARKFWPGEDPIGKSFRFGPPSMKGPLVTIVGVVGDARQFGLDRPVEPQYFFSAAQFPMTEARLVVRTTQDAASLGSAVRKIVSEYSPDSVVPKLETMDMLIDRSLTGRQDNVMLLGLFSGIALLLAAVGLYATMAYIVAQRTQEIGVRMALGADAGDIRTMMVREGALLALAGIGIGLVAALAVARVVSSMLYGVTYRDALTYAASASLLLLIMLVASYIPAWRASRVDPMTALRCE
jgi:putative ABC transport system permease protein